jgi:hypothetical protein
LAHQRKLEEGKTWLKTYQTERPEIKTVTDCKKVAPSLNVEIGALIVDGLKIAGLLE